MYEKDSNARTSTTTIEFRKVPHNHSSKDLSETRTAAHRAKLASHLYKQSSFQIYLAEIVQVLKYVGYLIVR